MKLMSLVNKIEHVRRTAHLLSKFEQKLSKYGFEWTLDTNTMYLRANSMTQVNAMRMERGKRRKGERERDAREEYTTRQK